MEFDSIEKVTNYLDSIPKFQSKGTEAAKFDLSRFRKFCDSINNPQDSFNSVHVGGTNGKGSTCCILATVYEQADYKTGLYTSPHIISFNERFRVKSSNIPDELLITFFNNFSEQIKKYQLTFFEISTAIAFWWFEHENVDLAFIEVGLGGRFDATNVITPLLSVITSIGLDHTDILGHTLKRIAEEKAGIIKPGKPVIIGNLAQEARKVIVKKARQQNSKVISVDEVAPGYLGPGRFEITDEKNKIIFNTDLLAPVQAINIGLAWQTVKQLVATYSVNKEQFQEGIQNVGIKYPFVGRFCRLLPDFRWYFDGGHNSEAVKAMKKAISTIQPVNETVLVLSLMKDKINKELLTEFLEFKKIYYHELDTDRAATLTNVKKWLPDVRSFPADRKHKQSLLKDLKSELVIFAGSFYFYATVRDWLNIITNNR